MSELSVQSQPEAESSQVPVFHPRSRIQRDEIGPVFHDIAHKVYDAAEGAVSSGFVGANMEHPTSLGQLLLNLDELKTYLESQANEYAQSEEWERFGRYISSSQPFTIAKNGALTEGLTSGVVAPFRLLQTVVSYGRAKHDYGDENPDIQDAVEHDWGEIEGTLVPDEEHLRTWADVIDEFAFTKMLTQLAYSANGFLGMASSSFGPLGRSLHFGRRWNVNDQFFVEDNEGKVIGFHPTFLARKKRDMSHRPYGGGNSSGGCPVRHSEFTRLSPNASEYLAAVNPDGRPVNEGESAIERGARLLSFTLRYMAEIPEA